MRDPDRGCGTNGPSSGTATWWAPIVALVAFGAAVWLVAASLDEIVDRLDAKYGGITATT
jgi:hypothetical protein